MKINTYWRGALLALTTAVCWGVISPIAKILDSAGIDLMSVMVFRSRFYICGFGVGFSILPRYQCVFQSSRDIWGFTSYLELFLLRLQVGDFLSLWNIYLYQLRSSFTILFLSSRLSALFL